MKQCGRFPGMTVWGISNRRPKQSNSGIIPKKSGICPTLPRRAQSKRGRYESAMWRAAGLEEPSAKRAKGSTAQVAVGEEAGAGDGEGGFEYDWEARRRARDRAFPRPRPGSAGGGAGPSGVTPPAAGDAESADDSELD